MAFLLLGAQSAKTQISKISFGYNSLPAPESLAGRLLLIRKVLGITQKEMAKRLGIDPSTLARLERGGESEIVLQDAAEARRLHFAWLVEFRRRQSLTALVH